MTTTTRALPEVEVAAPAPAAPPPVAAASPARGGGVSRVVGASLSLTALLVGGFLAYLYGVSALAEQRGQQVMYGAFAAQLSQAVAPVGPATDGKPVAILDIPRLGLRGAVVVEGTSGQDLTRGPGHRRDTVLPGQAGVSVLYGRTATFGAPFADLSRLRPGDGIAVTTGQGRATYVVKARGDGGHPPRDSATNRLVLTTANSGWIPTGTVSVSADLRTTSQPSPGGLPAITTTERGLAGDPDALVPLVLWGQALLLSVIAATVLTQRWSRWPAYLSLAPVVLAATWNVYENAAALLPNLY